MSILDDNSQVVDLILDYLNRKPLRTESQIRMVVNENFVNVKKIDSIITRLETLEFIVPKKNDGVDKYKLGKVGIEAHDNGGYTNYMSKKTEPNPSKIINVTSHGNAQIGDVYGKLTQSSVSELTNIENSTPNTKPSKTIKSIAFWTLIIAIITIIVMIWLDYN